uniref:Uncharacterized protein n=1 Tax=Staphylococcus aureus TaxID=1280 RepID=Q8VVR4_STAAU|nr:hypothetical protein SUA_0003p2 [Staphylococcus aureus]ADM28903.1 hypothetical protein SUD_0003 [Staphylococcus aureus]ADM28947.1 hypothetical protein SUH_0003 [Staphylococcus aureus]ADM28988.1 hypothetical protein SUI_0003 [Staphylococcus aureus]ADM29030.1 hypothetical protein SUJ_0003 [Staphylococcus aureus]
MKRVSSCFHTVFLFLLVLLLTFCFSIKMMLLTRWKKNMIIMKIIKNRRRIYAEKIY